MLASRLFTASVGGLVFASSIQSAAHADTMDPSSRSTPEADTGQNRDEGSTRKEKEHLRIGVLGGVGFPRPLAIEGMIKIEKILALGVEYSVLPTIVAYGVDTTFHALAADARIFPVSGPFFFGVRAGRQHLEGSATAIVNGVGMSGSLAMDTTFVNPRFGFLWTLGPGFSVGMDVGVQIPLSTSTAISLPEGTTANRQALRVANTFGNTVIPTIDLLRIGILL